MMSTKLGKNWKTSLIGVLLFGVGFLWKIDCLWFTKNCEDASTYKIGVLLLSGLVFLFLDEASITDGLKKLLDAVIGRIEK